MTKTNQASLSTPMRAAGRRIKKAVAGAAVAAATFGVGVDQAQAQQQIDQVPDYHEVQQGDTLWDLSGTYYGDTYQWPRLWSYNPHVTNPHWIYPGDIVYLKPTTQVPGGETAGRPGQELETVAQVPGEPAQGMYLPLGGFVAKEQVEYVGRIVASPKEANMLGEFDRAWVGFGDDSYTEKEKDEIDEDDRYAFKDPGKVNKGDKFAVVREAGPVVDSEGNTIGYKYVVLGAIEITETNEKYLDEAKVTKSWKEMYRNDMLLPFERQVRVVEPAEATEDTVAEIVDTLELGSLFGEHHYVFINKGAADGIRMGNRLFVYQQDEGLHFEAVDGEVSEEIPWQRVGQVLVVDVRENYATAVVTDSRKELNIGDRLEGYTGY